MRRKYIALKTGPGPWQYAVAGGTPGAATLLQAGTFEYDPQRPLAEQLAEQLEPLHMTDRLACALPAHNALLRWLTFPFSDARKIAAAADQEMISQLPGVFEQHVIYRQMQGDGLALCAAIERRKIEQSIEPFDDNREPLGYLGLAPFCYVAGLEWPVDSLLLCVDNDEISISRIEEAKVRDLRLLPLDNSGETRQILRQIQLLAHKGKIPLDRLRILGLDEGSALVAALKDQGFEIEFPSLSTPQMRVHQDLTSTAALALAAAKSGAADLNLRSGEFELKNDWQALKRRAGIGVGLLLTAALFFCVNGYLQYHQNTTRLNAVQRQITKLYQQQFPGERLRIPAPQQLQSKMLALQKKARQLGNDRPAALQVLKTVSEAMSGDLRVDIRDYQQNDAGLRLSGETESFDAVSRLLAKLQQQDIFQEVRIVDSKQALDGNRVDFQLQLDLQTAEAKQ